jgi:signal transduction histidine kinase
MSDVAFTYVASPALLVLDRLEMPLAIFSFGDRSLIWANGSALVHWRARSIDDLSQSEGFTPGPLIDAFLDAAQPVIRQGGRWEQPCHVGGRNARLLCTGISLDGHPEALLAEIRCETVLKADSAAAQVLQTSSADAFPGSRLQFASAQDRALFFEEMASRGQKSASAYLIAREGRRFEVSITDSGMQAGKVEGGLLVVQNIDDLHSVSVDQNPVGPDRIVSRKHPRMLEFASHEIRTRLAVIDGAAQRIARLATYGPPEPIGMLADRIRTTVARLGGLLEHMVEQGKRDRAETRSRMVPGQLQSVIAQAAVLFDEQADIEIAESVGQLPEIWFDPVLMEHVFVNLVENAIKYSIGRARLCISALASANRVQILVRDWGIGILPEERERVFAENVRGMNVGLQPGSGLGLYIVRAILQAHGGDVSVVETNGRGATLMVDLPIRQVAQSDTG